MIQICPRCSRPNPEGALYCYFDGMLLGGNGPDSACPIPPFPEPLVFSPERRCFTFDDLALACREHWETARALFEDGGFEEFFGRMGRLDLAVFARDAARGPDKDHGLDELVRRLPLQRPIPPKILVQPTTIDMGSVEDLADKKFLIHISHQGIGLLSGCITSDVPWLALSNRPAQNSRIFRFPNKAGVPVILRGSRWDRAGELRGQLFIDTTAGSATVAVRVFVPDAVFAQAQQKSAPLPRFTFDSKCLVHSSRSKRQPAFAVLAGLFLVVLLGALAAWRFWHSRSSPLEPFASLLPRDAVLVSVVDFRALDDTDLQGDGVRLGQAEQSTLRGLALQPTSATVTAAVSIITKESKSLRVYVFSEPISVGKVLDSRYTRTLVDGTEIWLDGAAPTAFAIDSAGRLIQGPRDLVLATLTRVSRNHVEHAVQPLLGFSTGLPADAHCWGVLHNIPGNYRGNGNTLLLEHVVRGTFQLQCTKDSARFIARLVCKSEIAAAALQRQKESVLTGLQRQWLGAAEPPIVGLLASSLTIIPAGADLMVSVDVPAKILTTAWQARADHVLESYRLAQEKWNNSADELVRQGDLFLQDGKFTQAKAAFEKALERGQKRHDIYKKLKTATDGAFATHMKLGEDMLAQEKYGEAKRIFDDALRCSPNDDTANTKLVQARAGEERNKQLQKALEELDAAISARDPKRAAAKLIAAEKIRADSPTLIDFRVRLKGLRDDLAFAEAFRNASHAVAALKLLDAQKHLTDALHIKPRDADALRRLKSIENALDLERQRGQVRERLLKNRLEDALKGARHAAQVVLKENRLAAAPDPLKSRWIQLTAEIIADLWSIVDHAAIGSQEHALAAATEERKDQYKAALDRYRLALHYLDCGHQTLVELRRFEGALLLTKVNSTAADLERQAMKVQSDMQRCLGQDHVKMAQIAIQNGLRLFEMGKSGNEQLLNAQSALDAAIADLHAAAKYPGIDIQTDLDRARKQRAAIARMIQPVHLQFADKQLLKDWTRQPTPKFVTRAGKVWLRGADGKITTLSSPPLYFPDDFALEVQLGVLTPGKTLDNSLLGAISDAFQFTLRAQDGTNTALVLGKDPDLPFQHFASIRLDKRNAGIQFSIEDGKPIKVLLTRRGATASLKVNGRTLLDESMPRKFDRLTVTLQNGVNSRQEPFGYPAILELSLRLDVARHP